MRALYFAVLWLAASAAVGWALAAWVDLRVGVFTFIALVGALAAWDRRRP